MKTTQLIRTFLLSSLITAACDSGGGAPSESEVDAGVEPAVHDTSVTPEQLTGTYLFGISTVLARSAPIVVMVELQAELRDEQLEVRLRERPISKLDRVTPVGEWSDWILGSVDADGEWNSNSIHVVIPADANSIIATDTEVDIVLSSRLLELRSEDDPAGQLEFLCGDVAGQIIDPIPVDNLDGSTFAGTRIEDVDDLASYPEVTINCDHGLPRALR